MQKLILSAVQFAEICNVTIDPDFGTTCYELDLTKLPKTEVSTEPMSKKAICVSIMQQMLVEGKELKRSILLKIFMEDPRLNMAKSAANTYFYSCLDVLKTAGQVK